MFLDNLPHLFAGDENSRSDVTSFMNMLVGALPDRAIILSVHVAKAIGSEYSASTAWENAARQRLWLTRTPPGSGSDGNTADDDTIFLCRRKANYAAQDALKLVWRDGLFVPDVGVDDNEYRHLRRRQAERIAKVAIAKAVAAGKNLSDSPNAMNSAGRFAKETGLLERRVSVSDVNRAVSRLMVPGEVLIGEVGRYSTRHARRGLVLRSQGA